MADTREVFTILEDNSTAEGVKLPARASGDAAGGNHIPALVSKDGAGNYQLIQQRAAGAAVTGNELPVLPAEDLAGNYEHIQVREEGDAVGGNELPVLPVKDSSGNLAHIPLDANGRIPVTTFAQSEGTKLSANAVVTASALNGDDEVVAVTLATAVNYERVHFMVSATQLTHWDLVAEDDGTDTILASFMTGSGQYSFAQRLEDLVFASGATGVQRIKIVANQKHGAVTDLHGFISLQTV